MRLEGVTEPSAIKGLDAMMVAGRMAAAGEDIGEQPQESAHEQ
jgi:hypothetical protein